MAVQWFWDGSGLRRPGETKSIGPAPPPSPVNRPGSHRTPYASPYAMPHATRACSTSSAEYEADLASLPGSRYPPLTRGVRTRPMHWGGGGGLVRLTSSHPGDSHPRTTATPYPKSHSLAIVRMGRKGFGPIKGNKRGHLKKLRSRKLRPARFQAWVRQLVSLELGSKDLVVKELD